MGGGEARGVLRKAKNNVEQRVDNERGRRK